MHISLNRREEQNSNGKMFDCGDVFMCKVKEKALYMQNLTKILQSCVQFTDRIIHRLLKYFFTTLFCRTGYSYKIVFSIC